MSIKKIMKPELKDKFFNIRFTNTQKDKIKQASKANSVTYSAVVRAALNEYFEIND